MRRNNRAGAHAYQVCIKCNVRRQIPWHLRLEPTHQPGVYVCKFCKPVKVRNGAHGVMDPEYRRDWNLTKRYGLGAAEYDAMLAAQGGVCAICGAAPKNQRLPVDHHHGSGAVRGILCTSCNSRLEWFERWHDAVVSYLSREMSPST